MKLRQIVENTTVEAPIYRGLRVPPGTELGDIIELSVRPDRQPKDTSVLASMLFNYGIECRFGIADIRKTSIFAASSEYVAEQYSTFSGGGVIQLVLPEDAVAVYHPDVSDSMNILERKDVKDFANHVGKYIEDPTRAQYISTNSGELFQQLVSNEIEDGEDFVETMRMFQDLAIQMTEGWNAVRVGDLNEQPNSVEYMINGVRAYSGKVIHLHESTPKPEQNVDDDGIPF